MMCTAQILVAFLTGYAMREFSFNQSEALPRSGQCTLSVWNFCARYLDVVLRGSSGDLTKRWLFSQASYAHTQQGLLKKQSKANTPANENYTLQCFGFSDL